MPLIDRGFGLINTWNDLQDDGIEDLLYPSFFIGQELSADDFPAVWNSFLNRMDGASRERRRDAAKEIKEESFKDGQFVFQHQYAGTACLQSVLFGIFLPLRTCRDVAIGKRIEDSISHIGPPEVSGFPVPANLQAWTKAMAEIGPLAVSQQERAAQEAMIRFSNLEELYPWLMHRFQYVSQFSGPDASEIKHEWDAATGLNLDPAYSWDWDRRKFDAIDFTEEQKERIKKITDRSRRERRISQTMSLPWVDIAAFASWLSRGEGILKVAPRDIRMSLVWFNSD